MVFLISVIFFNLFKKYDQPSSWSLASWFAFPINPACRFKIPSYSHPWEVWNMHVYWRSESNWEFLTLSFALYHTILFSRFVQLHKICDIVFGFFINIDLACIILQIPVYSIIRSGVACFVKFRFMATCQPLSLKNIL